MKKLLPWLWKNLDEWVLGLLTFIFFLTFLGSEISHPNILKAGGPNSWILSNESHDIAICLINGFVGLGTVVFMLIMIAVLSLLFFGLFCKHCLLGTIIWLIGGCSQKYFYAEAPAK